MEAAFIRTSTAIIASLSRIPLQHGYTVAGGGEDGDGRGRSEIDETPVTIVGPEGLRCGCVRCWATRMPRWSDEARVLSWSGCARSKTKGSAGCVRPSMCAAWRGEVPGLDLEPCADGVWRIPERLDGKRPLLDPPMSISAVELDHTVPTVGWVLQEAPQVSTLDGARVKLLRRRRVCTCVNTLKRLKDGESLKLPDGTVLNPSDFMGSSTSRKLCILSDMRGAKVNSTLYDEIADANLIVHEHQRLPDAPESDEVAKGRR